MVVAIPPEPVAAFRNEHLLAGAGQRRISKTSSRIRQCTPRLDELTPGTVVVRMTDPDIEVPVDPGAREDRRERLGRPRARLAHRDRLHFGMRREPSVESAQKRPSLVFVVLPGILAVENHK